MYEPHRPRNYVGGALIREQDIWIGKFEATAGELYTFATEDAQTVEEYETVLDMIQAQQEYMLWWDKVRNKV
jgi:hypothetical protein